MASIEERFPRASVMGVVNVTPDSFSDGGVNVEAALVAEVDVHERHVRAELARQLNRLRAGRRDADDCDALALQERPRRGEVPGVVVDYQ